MIDKGTGISRQQKLGTEPRSNVLHNISFGGSKNRWISLF